MNPTPQCSTWSDAMVLDLMRKLFAFLSSLWALADIVLDTVTVIRYRDLCQVRSSGHHISRLVLSHVSNIYVT